VNHLQAAVGSIPRWSTRSAPAPTVARHCHPPGVFHQFRPSLAPWSVRDALMDELFGRNTADRVAEGHRGIRGDQQGSWPCAAAAAPRMHPFERRGAATDKRPRPNPNSSTTSDRQFVMASMSESTMHRHASKGHRVALTAVRLRRWTDLASQLHRGVRQQRSLCRKILGQAA
jgi:hypothetical protein